MFPLKKIMNRRSKIEPIIYNFATELIKIFHL